MVALTQVVGGENADCWNNKDDTHGQTLGEMVAEGLDRRHGVVVVAAERHRSKKWRKGVALRKSCVMMVRTHDGVDSVVGIHTQGEVLACMHGMQVEAV